MPEMMLNKLRNGSLAHR